MLETRHKFKVTYSEKTSIKTYASLRWPPAAAVDFKIGDLFANGYAQKSSSMVESNNFAVEWYAQLRRASDLVARAETYARPNPTVRHDNRPRRVQRVSKVNRRPSVTDKNSAFPTCSRQTQCDFRSRIAY